MKIAQKTKLDLSMVTVSRHIRSDLAKRVEEYWVGKPNSNIGLQYLRFKDGRIKASEGEFERKDLLMFQLLLIPHAGFNCFVEPSGRMELQCFEGTKLSDTEVAELRNHIQETLNEPETAKYMDHERTFLQAKPWLQVDGMTPEEAVDKFKELGWY